MKTRIASATRFQLSWIYAVAALLLCAACEPKVRVSLDGMPTKLDALYGRVVAASILKIPASERHGKAEPGLIRIDDYAHPFTLGIPLAIEGTGIVELYGLESGCTVVYGAAPFGDLADAQVHIQLGPVPAEQVRCRLALAYGDEVPREWNVESVQASVSLIGVFDSPEQRVWDWLVPVREDIQLTPKSALMLPANRSVQCQADENVAVTPRSDRSSCAVRVEKSATVRLALGASLPRLDVEMVGQPLGSRILSTPAGIDCPGHCQALFPGGSVRLELASTDARSYFVDWSEPSCGSAASCKLSVAATGTALRARFAPRVCPAPGLCWENPLPQGNELNAVHGRAPDSVWAVGKQGTILAFNGFVWSLEPSGTTAELRAVYATETPGEAWAVGSSGTILYRSPASGSWQPIIPSGTTEELSAVFSKNGSTLAVGAGGTVCSFPAPRGTPPCRPQLGAPGTRPLLTGLWFEQSSATWAMSAQGALWFIPNNTPSSLPASAKAKALFGWSAPACGEGNTVSVHAIDAAGRLYSWDTAAKQWVVLPKCSVTPSSMEVTGAFSQGKELYGLSNSSHELTRLKNKGGDSTVFEWDMPKQLSAAKAGWLAAEGGWLVGDTGAIQSLRLSPNGYTLTSWVPDQHTGSLQSIHGLKRETLISVGGNALLRRSEQTGRWAPAQTQAMAQAVVREVAPGKYWIGGETGLLYRLNGQDWQQFELQDKLAAVNCLWSRPYLPDQEEAPLWGETDKLQLFYKPVRFGQPFTRSLGSDLDLNKVLTGRSVRSGVNTVDIIYILGTNNDIYQVIPPNYNIVETSPCFLKENLAFKPLDIWALPDRDGLLISGDFGRLLYAASCQASTIRSLNAHAETSDAVNRVTGSNSHYLGVGQNGLILEGHFDNNGPMNDATELMRITNQTLLDAHILNDQDAYIVGGGGNIFRYYFK